MILHLGKKTPYYPVVNGTSQSDQRQSGGKTSEKQLRSSSNEQQHHGNVEGVRNEILVEWE